MDTTAITSREFERDTRAARVAANRGPVIITHRGRPTHVLLSFAYFQRLAFRKKSLLDAIAQTNGGDFEFKPPRLRGGLFEPADLE